MQDKIERLEKRIKEILAESPVSFELSHGIAVREVLLKLNPMADLATQIAALGHDIDRGVSKIVEGELKESNYELYKDLHAQRSAEVMKDLLEKEGFEKEFVDKVYRIVRYHEVGGDRDTNDVMEADSIAFFEPEVLKIYLDKNGLEKLKKKMNFALSRASERAVKIVTEMEFDNKGIQSILNEVLREINEQK